MQLTEAYYFALFTISVTATCVEAEHAKETKGIDIASDERVDRRFSRRDSNVIIGNYPMEALEVKRPKVIYRRIMKQRYRADKPKFGKPAAKSKYVTPKSRHRSTTTRHKKAKAAAAAAAKKPPVKKYKVKKLNLKYAQQSNKQSYSPKPRRARPSQQPRSPPVLKYKIPRVVPEHPQGFFPDSGFAEPPRTHNIPKEVTKPSYAEPPVDSYGLPLKTTAFQTFPTDTTGPDYVDATSPLNIPEPQGTAYYRWPDFNQDSNFAYSNKHSAFAGKPVNYEDSPMQYDEQSLHSYADVFKYNKKQASNYDKSNNLENDYVQNNQVYLNKPWKMNNLHNDDHDQIVVGGQYAEPPGRYVPKEQAGHYFDEEQVIAGFVRPDDVAASATISPYVNYKNSNMAFSPQNLNDAFGIID